jgi:cupin 2 domain-containing protein
VGDHSLYFVGGRLCNSDAEIVTKNGRCVEIHPGTKDLGPVVDDGLSYIVNLMNLFDDLPHQASEEVFTELLSREGVRIERIVSTGQSTPTDQPYNQEWDEWVLLVSGRAGLWIEGKGEHELRPGDYFLIPAHRSHRVTWTAIGEPTVWLAVHLS